ncbi:serine hydroxymethyltransferase [Streptomyces cyanogenus]|uniref:Probable serine hydroxymethyltransferase n=1 Tax=Streptomyces cyanogenus TaxID=80860 RepID=A0ABX7TSI2_STRCY|nr:serine hydroxymethyltransferase [Streptomyces cyanogenus]QTD99700.1 Serine hydroxymethyltransferase [Streptomyces cyanogenus]
MGEHLAAVDQESLDQPSLDRVSLYQDLSPGPWHDTDTARLIAAELSRQRETVNLTAAANYLSPAVSAAMHPALESIHCEGYPGRRYHEGQETADAIERLAIQRARRLFGADHANVQPYRGTTANLAAAVAVLEPGDTLLGLQTASGGHYTTGSSLHLIGRMFRVVPYEVAADTCTLDYDALARVARAERPRAIFCGDTSYPRLWDWAALRAVADETGAVLVADISQSAGLIAGGAIPSPAPHADIMTAATYKTLRGPRAGLILAREGLAKAVDRAVYPICQGGTNVRVLAGVATALGEALTESFAAYTREVLANSRCLADHLARQGFDLVAGGTDNHACLADMRSFGTTGDAAARRLAAAGILANGNQIPHDPNPPRRPSGLRFGTAAVTTLGMGRAAMAEIAGLIAAVLREDGERTVDEVRGRVSEIRRAHATPATQWSDIDAEELVRPWI